MAYNTTSVSVEKSQGDIRKMLQRHGAQRFGFTQGLAPDGKRWVQLEFVYAQEYDRPHLIRLAVPLKDQDQDAISAKARRAHSKTRNEIESEAYEQEERRIWRVIYYSLKSRMEAVEEEVETFEQAWLPHIVDPLTGVTLWDRIKPSIEAGKLVIGGPGLPALGAGKK
jgi:hypothetical protein